MSEIPREMTMNCTIDHIRAAWLEVPELRLGQLIVNSLPLVARSDPFYITDDELLVAVEKYVQNLQVRRARA